VEDRGPGRHAVHGTPADCVRIALFGLHLKPDMVLSGVNQGGNMGQDLVISGTVAAAREAAFHGVRALSLSHYMISGLGFDWPRVSAWTAEMIGRLLGETLKDGEYWNINYPHLPPGELELPKMVLTLPARSPLKVSFESRQGDSEVTYHYTARYAERPQDEGSDVAACFGGKVSVSKLRL
jgi:5'-nucleotidase